MGQHYGPKIITDNLVVNLDAADVNSYPGSGNFWYNVGSYGGYFSKYTYLPVWTTYQGVTCFNFNQVQSAFVNGSAYSTAIPANGANLTMECWFNLAASDLTSGDMNCLFRGYGGSNSFYMSLDKSTLKMAQYFYGKSMVNYDETGAAITRGTWNCFVAAYDGNQLRQYTNNVKTTSTTNGMNCNASTGLQIGWENDGRQFAGYIASIKIYDRNLSDDEINRNFQIQRKRFNI